MKKIFNFTICYLLASTIYSCTKPLNIDIPQSKPKLAIFSQIIPNQAVAITITRSFSALTDLAATTSSDSNPNGVLVGRAFVTITHKNSIDTLKKITDGLYGSINTNFITGDYYELNVYDSTSGERVKSIAQVLPIVEDSLKVTVDKTPTDTIFSIVCRVKDNPNIQEYYYLNVSNVGQNNFQNQTSDFFTNINASKNFILLSDQEAVNGFIENEVFNISNKERIAQEKDSITVVVASISKGYFDFLTAYKKGNSLFSQIFGEPINYPSNVENGVGIFTAHIPKIYFLDLKNY
jgi:hypothetical protein